MNKIKVRITPSQTIYFITKTGEIRRGSALQEEGLGLEFLCAEEYSDVSSLFLAIAAGIKKAHKRAYFISVENYYAGAKEVWHKWDAQRKIKKRCPVAEKDGLHGRGTVERLIPRLLEIYDCLVVTEDD